MVGSVEIRTRGFYFPDWLIVGLFVAFCAVLAAFILAGLLYDPAIGIVAAVPFIFGFVVAKSRANPANSMVDLMLWYRMTRQKLPDTYGRITTHLIGPWGTYVLDTIHGYEPRLRAMQGSSTDEPPGYAND